MPLWMLPISTFVSTFLYSTFLSQSWIYHLRWCVDRLLLLVKVIWNKKKLLVLVLHLAAIHLPSVTQLLVLLADRPPIICFTFSSKVFDLCISPFWYFMVAFLLADWLSITFFVYGSIIVTFVFSRFSLFILSLSLLLAPRFSPLMFSILNSWLDS